MKYAGIYWGLFAPMIKRVLQSDSIKSLRIVLSNRESQNIGVCWGELLPAGECETNIACDLKVLLLPKPL